MKSAQSTFIRAKDDLNTNNPRAYIIDNSCMKTFYKILEFVEIPSSLERFVVLMGFRFNNSFFFFLFLINFFHSDFAWYEKVIIIDTLLYLSVNANHDVKEMQIKSSEKISRLHQLMSLHNFDG